MSTLGNLPRDDVSTDEDAARIQRIVELVADRCADPERVAAVAGAPTNRDPIYEVIPWEPVTLSHGYPGTALLYGQLAEIEPGWERVAHRHLQAAVRATDPARSNGLFSGPAAVLAAAQNCTRQAGHYNGLRERLTEWVSRDQQRKLAQQRVRWERGELGVPWNAYDVVNGVSGVGRVLLDAVAGENRQERLAVTDALNATLTHLVRLTEPITVDGRQLPGWWVPPELEPVEEDRRYYPNGDFNLGMAHGVAGPLALLAMAAERGRTVAGQLEAIERVGTWLESWVMYDVYGPYWPCRVSWENEVSAARPAEGFTRTAWCYGAPGVASALYRASGVVGNAEWRELAVASLRTALQRPETEWRLDGPTVCHGYAGFLDILCGVGGASGDGALIAGARRLARRVLDFADENAPFVFSHLIPDSPDGWQSATRHRALDVAGVLEGAAGTACALLTAVSGQPFTDSDNDAPQQHWDKVLMLG